MGGENGRRIDRRVPSLIPEQIEGTSESRSGSIGWQAKGQQNSRRRWGLLDGVP